MFGNLSDVSVKPNAEIGSFFEDLFDELQAGHGTKIQFEVRSLRFDVKNFKLRT